MQDGSIGKGSCGHLANRVLMRFNWCMAPLCNLYLMELTPPISCLVDRIPMALDRDQTDFLAIFIVFIVSATGFLVARLTLKGRRDLIGPDDVLLAVGLVLTYALMVNGIICER